MLHIDKNYRIDIEHYRMIRTFWPVGHGLFCSERFVDYYGKTSNVVVYDCGVIKRKIQWDDIEDKFIPRGHNRKIDLLFISHFHEDHLSGIKYLLDHYEVENIILPVITTSKFAESYLYNLINSNAIPLYNSILVGLAGGTIGRKLVRVPDTKQLFSADHGDVFITPTSLTNTLRPGFGVIMNDWIYLPFNHIEPKEAMDFEDDLKKEYPDLYNAFVNIDEPEIMKQIIKIGKTELKTFYGKHFKKDGNCASMAVYSGPRIIGTNTRKVDSCLYTGDYPMRNEKYLDDIKLFYKYYWNSIGTMQVPHHGADEDNPESLYNTFEHRTCVISAEKGDLKHPGREALINIINSRSFVRLVTQDLNTRFSQRIQIV